MRVSTRFLMTTSMGGLIAPDYRNGSGFPPCDEGAFELGSMGK